MIVFPALVIMEWHPTAIQLWANSSCWWPAARPIMAHPIASIMGKFQPAVWLHLYTALSAHSISICGMCLPSL